MVKVIERRYGHLHTQGHIGVVCNSRGGRPGEMLAQFQLADTLSKDLGVEAVKTMALLQYLLDTRQGMLLQ